MKLTKKEQMAMRVQSGIDKVVQELWKIYCDDIIPDDELIEIINTRMKYFDNHITELKDTIEAMR